MDSGSKRWKSGATVAECKADSVFTAGAQRLSSATAGGGPLERMVMFRRLDEKTDWDHIYCCVVVLPPVCTRTMGWRILSFDDVLPTFGKPLRCALVDGQPGPTLVP